MISTHLAYDDRVLMAKTKNWKTVSATLSA
jgi:hypothetical protein